MALKPKSAKKTSAKTKAAKTDKNTPKKVSKEKKQSHKFIVWLKKTTLYASLFFLFIFVSYIGYLDYTVRYEFEGKRWSIPAKVYAGSVELYEGFPMTAVKLEPLLKRMNYHADSLLKTEGTYDLKGNSLHLYTRSFRFWDKQHDGMHYLIEFNDRTIKQIINQDISESKAVLRLDPVHIGSFYPSRKEDRVLLKLEEAPDLLVQGLLVTEDKDFYHHFGISPLGIARAMFANLRAGSIVQGGSTITQQLVKNMFLSSERKIWRKINEALMAVIMDFRFEKDEILEAYLNEIYLGQDGARSVHGFGLASRFYFGRDINVLKPHQIATLVAIVKGPSWYDPRRSPERLIARRNIILEKMHEYGYITKRQLMKGKEQGADVIPRQHHAVNRYPAFLELVKRQLHDLYDESDLTSEGLRIFTTLDVTVQDTLEDRVSKKLAYLEKKPKVARLETAAIVTRRDNGEIVAMAGGRNPRQSGYNRAMDAMRPVGSLIKPFVYLTALEYPKKYTVTTKVSDRKIKVKAQKGQYWRPSNYDHKEHGDVPLHRALANSYNLATVRIGMDIGVGRIGKTLRNAGIKRGIDLYPSMLLGATPMTPLEVTQMYQTLTGDGFATPLRAIQAVTSAKGEALQRYPYNVRQTLDPAATYLTNTLMQEVMQSGTGKSAGQYFADDMHLAGKTGTSNGLRDSWFAGFSGDYLSVIWMGRDDNKPAGLSGSSGALQLWISLMRKIARQPVLLTQPDNVVQALVDPESGMLAAKSCSGARFYPYIKGSTPRQKAPCAQNTLEKAGGTLEKTQNKLENWFESIFE